jgi:hypothetical protein
MRRAPKSFSTADSCDNLRDASAAKLRQSGDPTMAQLADAHERVAREIQERIDREAPALAPD